MPATPPWASGMSFHRIRHEVWERLERGQLALPPRPCYYRVPNFVGVAEATRRLESLPEFQQARCVLCTGDYVLDEARRLVLASGRSLALIHADALWEVSALDARDYDTLLWMHRVIELGRPLRAPVDLIVVGSIAVDLHGTRVGRRQSPEETLLRALIGTALVPANAPVATLVHELQVYPRIPRRNSPGPHVTLILTPERVIRVEPETP